LIEIPVEDESEDDETEDDDESDTEGLAVWTKDVEEEDEVWV
jgi:hypothetical protein